MRTGYVVNGIWAECLDRDGNKYYVCDLCGRREGTGHDKNCYVEKQSQQRIKKLKEKRTNRERKMR